MRTFVPDRTCWSLLLTALAIILRYKLTYDKLQVLIINKDVRKSLARKNGNEIPIWSWNDSTLMVEFFYSVLISVILFICSSKTNFIYSYTREFFLSDFSVYLGFYVIISQVILTKSIVSYVSCLYLPYWFINKKIYFLKHIQYKKYIHTKTHRTQTR